MMIKCKLVIILHSGSIYMNEICVISICIMSILEVSRAELSEDMEWNGGFFKPNEINRIPNVSSK